MIKSLSQASDEEELWLRSAARLACRAEATAYPNPAVGALLIKNGESQPLHFAQGVTAKGGRPHAECDALQRAGALTAQGATLFVTLEPCHHQSQRGSACVDLLINAGIRRVVIGCLDPDPRTSGKSVDKLLAHNISVALSASPENYRALLAAHLSVNLRNRPLIIAKLALSADKKIAGEGGQPQAITGSLANRFSHALRATSDAIAVGATTWHRDRPLLTCRLPGLSSMSPQPVILSSTIKEGAFEPVKDGKIPWVLGGDIGTIIERLTQRGVRQLLVEGGAQVLESLLSGGLADRFYLWQSSTLSLGRKALGIESYPYLSELIEHPANWTIACQRHYDKDRLTIMNSPDYTKLIRNDDYVYRTDHRDW